MPRTFFWRTAAGMTPHQELRCGPARSACIGSKRSRVSSLPERRGRVQTSSTTPKTGDKSRFARGNHCVKGSGESPVFPCPGIHAWDGALYASCRRVGNRSSTTRSPMVRSLATNGSRHIQRRNCRPILRRKRLGWGKACAAMSEQTATQSAICTRSRV